jgi:hypothetical protein
MNHCEIFHVPYKKSFRWKWRHVSADGKVKESQESYELYYECVCEARKNGYEPRLGAVEAA